jgi:serine/threonine protein kinase
MDNGDLLFFLEKFPRTPKMPLVNPFPLHSPQPFAHMALQIFDIISDLEYLHGCGIVHGDLKAVGMFLHSSLVRADGIVRKTSLFRTNRWR